MAAIVAPQPVDLKTQATWPIQLGASLSKPNRSPRYTAVRCNHKPSLAQNAKVTGKILPGKRANDCELSLTEGKGSWKYTGKHTVDPDSYVLLLSGDGDHRTATLESLGGSHTFNLISTPTEKDAESLRQQYPPISFANDGEGSAEEQASSGEVDEEADSDNPYDYRHFLKLAIAKVESQREDAIASNASTPLVKPHASVKTAPARSSQVTPASAAQKKRKTATATVQPAAKRTKTAQQSQPAPNKPAAGNASTTPIPTVRLTRKASLRYPGGAEPDEDDTGELILENEDDSIAKARSQRGQPSAMSLALSGQFGNGPISLHSAASSPASRIDSPAPERPANMDDEDVFDLGGGTPGRDDEDDDVDAFELPSPVQDRASDGKGRAALAAAGEDDDDLGEQLARAMAEQEDEPVIARRDESEEESEEE